MDNIENYKGINILSGINTHPGSGTANQHEEEYKIFKHFLSFLQNKKNPVMVELGSNWALWSLCFRKEFPNGKNILIELGKRALNVGIKNFKLNKFSEKHYWGGFFLENSGTFKNKKADLEYSKVEGEYFDDCIKGPVVGPELNFLDIWNKEKIHKLDVLHMDIQGSEFPLIMQLRDDNKLVDINNLFIATHSVEIHNTILKILLESHFAIIVNKPFGSVGGDGLLCATRKNP